MRQVQSARKLREPTHAIPTGSSASALRDSLIKAATDEHFAKGIWEILADAQASIPLRKPTCVPFW
ncbi:hypothetical protein BJX63DRAFT_409945 [Aspergillus granulosus]|uniref:Uncharacterized protein n=1 Tax=Aspergillus granulosus TaxID=176169 RepID=A0ABR4H068_9EURO